MDKINLNDLDSKDPKIKYQCVKEILRIGKESPKALYSDINLFIKLLDSQNNILKWTAIDLMGYLASVDKDKIVDGYLDKLIGFLNAGKLITANHVIQALSDIVKSKPEHRERITEELLKVENYSYDTDECCNIALGKVILAFGSYFDLIEDRKKIIEFVERQVNNTRKATNKKAEQFLRKFK